MNIKTVLAVRAERRRVQQERKRLRRKRAEIHAAMERVAQIAREHPAYAPPFRCEQSKSEEGWRVIDSAGVVAGVASSRDAQRAMRDALNADPPPPLSRDDAMRKQGFERIGDSGSIEQRFRAFGR